MVKGFFEQLGCQESRVYDVGMTEWGAQGNPVVYAKCDEGAPRTHRHLLAVRHDAGDAARRVEGAAVRRRASSSRRPFKKVLIGRGATNSKGPEMAS